jgi:hypothetical protein
LTSLTSLQPYTPLATPIPSVFSLFFACSLSLSLSLFFGRSLSVSLSPTDSAILGCAGGLEHGPRGTAARQCRR